MADVNNSRAFALASAFQVDDQTPIQQKEEEDERVMNVVYDSLYWTKIIEPFYLE